MDLLVPAGGSKRSGLEYYPFKPKGKARRPSHTQRECRKMLFDGSAGMDPIDRSSGMPWKIVEIFGWVGRGGLEIRGILMPFSKQKIPRLMGLEA